MYSIIRFVQQTECLNCFTDLKENVSFLENSGQIFIAYPTLVFKCLLVPEQKGAKPHLESHYFTPCLSSFSLCLPLSLSLSFTFRA